MTHYMQMPCGVWLRKLDLSSPQIATAESIGLVYLESNLSIALSVEMFLFVFVFVCGSVQISNFIIKAFSGILASRNVLELAQPETMKIVPRFIKEKDFFLSSPRRCEKKTSRQAFAKQETAKVFLSVFHRTLTSPKRLFLPSSLSILMTQWLITDECKIRW